MITTKKKHSHSDFVAQVNGTNLEKCDSYKYLGVYFDKDLNWKTHIDHVCKKVSQACGSITKLRNCVDTETLREVYHALAHSYIRYGIIAWGSAAQSNLTPLKVIMNRILRIMSNAPLGRVEVAPLFDIFEILSIEKIYELEVGKFMFKKEKNLLPVQIAQYFQLITFEQSRYILRARPTRNIHLDQRTTQGEKSIQKRGPNIWRSIPDDLKTIESHIFFKKKFKSFLLDSQNSEA